MSFTIVRLCAILHISFIAEAVTVWRGLAEDCGRVHCNVLIDVWSGLRLDAQLEFRVYEKEHL